MPTVASCAAVSSALPSSRRCSTSWSTWCREFADLMLDAWLCTTESSRNEAFDALGSRLQEAKQHHEDAKALDESLFGEDFETA
jgi:hypothetical protein